jgi:hypothetical protein
MFVISLYKYTATKFESIGIKQYSFGDIFFSSKIQPNECLINQAYSFRGNIDEWFNTPIKDFIRIRSIKHFSEDELVSFKLLYDNALLVTDSVKRKQHLIDLGFKAETSISLIINRCYIIDRDLYLKKDFDVLWEGKRFSWKLKDYLRNTYGCKYLKSTELIKRAFDERKTINEKAFEGGSN